MDGVGVDEVGLDGHLVGEMLVEVEGGEMGGEGLVEEVDGWVGGMDGLVGGEDGLVGGEDGLVGGEDGLG